VDKFTRSENCEEYFLRILHSSYNDVSHACQAPASLGTMLVPADVYVRAGSTVLSIHGRMASLLKMTSRLLVLPAGKTSDSDYPPHFNVKVHHVQDDSCTKCRQFSDEV
jgi:hypothetical protein